MFERDPAAETDCGTYVEHSPDPCDEGGGGLDTGGDPTTCDERRAANEAVVACIADSAAANVAHSFSHHFEGDIPTIDWVVHVEATGASWSTRTGDDDLCTIDEATVHLPADLSGCDAWTCIADGIESAGVKGVCRDESACDGI